MNVSYWGIQLVAGLGSLTGFKNWGIHIVAELELIGAKERSFRLATSEEWEAIVPEWARNRREEILERIRRDWRTTRFYRLKFE